MNTFIVPVDFSGTSFNAARYAAILAASLPEAQLVLYHTCIAADNPGGEKDVVQEAQAATGRLTEDLRLLAPDAVFTQVVNTGFLLEGITALAQEHKAAMIVMGITGKGKVAQKLIGSNTIAVTLGSGFPVLIVPGEASFRPIRRMALALRLREHLLETVPYETIRHITALLGAALMVVNVDDDDENTPARYVYSGQQAAHVMFDDAGASYHMLDGPAVAAGIENFAIANDVQVIITVAQEHSWFGRLLGHSVTSKLAYGGHLPVLAFKAADRLT